MLTLIYSCDLWPLTERFESKFNSMEIRFLRRIQVKLEMIKLKQSFQGVIKYR